MVNGVFSVSVNGNSGLDYMLQSATNLNPPVNWLTLQTNFSATPPFNFNDSNTSNCAAKFYRVQIGP